MLAAASHPQLCGLFAEVCGPKYASLLPSMLPSLTAVIISVEDHNPLVDQQASDVQYGASEWSLLYVALVTLTKVGAALLNIRSFSRLLITDHGLLEFHFDLLCRYS